MPARCFLIEPLRQHSESTSDLLRFGQIVYLFANNEDRPSIFDGERFAEEVCNRLDAQMFNIADDYIVIAGSINASAQLLALAGMEFTTKDYQTVKTLMFVKAENAYTPVNVG